MSRDTPPQPRKSPVTVVEWLRYRSFGSRKAFRVKLREKAQREQRERRGKADGQ